MAAQADPTATPSCTPCSPTRRRGETLEHAIFDAVLDQLQTVGYAGLTMEGVAACAHTGKAALYRRWPCKEDLVVDALHHTLPSLADLPDHGNVRDDLLDLLCRVAALVNSPTGCALQSLMAEIDQDRPFARILHDRVLEPRKRMFLDVLERGARRGEVRPDAVSQLVAEVGPAMLVQRFFVDGAPVPDAYVVSVLDDLVMPLLRPWTEAASTAARRPDPSARSI
ncbi:MAG TPA: TetR/AcrR family transcriptional regulator [Actinomycetes bacterium]|jgi:AcrR family transcriptional regulator|nr:TetR/AcrR family transcriptional regulator [Actinomycetes bacterium]